MGVWGGGEVGGESGAVSDLHCEVVLVATQEGCGRGCYGNTVGSCAGERRGGWEGLEWLYLIAVFRSTYVCVCLSAGK